VKVPENISKREQIEVDMIKKLITSYFNVVKKNINDSIPKTVINFLVNGVKQKSFFFNIDLTISKVKEYL